MERASEGMCPCKCGHFEHFFCEQTLANILHYLIISYGFGSGGFCPWCQIFTVSMLQFFELVKDSERRKSKMLIFCIVLVFASIFMTFDRYMLDR